MMTSLVANPALVLILLVASFAVMLIPLEASKELKPKPPEFVNACNRKMGLECGNAINVYTFGKGTRPSDDCCNELIKTGPECHDAVVTKHLIGKPQDYIDYIQKKSDWIWGHCVRVLRYIERHS